MGFGEWLRTKIYDARLSNAEVARRADVSPTYIGNLVNGATPGKKTPGPSRPSEEVVENIARAVGASIDEARLAAGYAPLQTRSITFPLPADLSPEDVDDVKGEMDLAFQIIMHRRRSMSVKGTVKKSHEQQADSPTFIPIEDVAVVRPTIENEADEQQQHRKRKRRAG